MNAQIGQDHPNESKPQVGEYFAAVAERWDHIRTSYFDESVREAAIAQAGLSSEMVVADVGTGTGFIAEGLAPLVRRVYAVDASAEMLGVLERKLREQGIANVEPRQGDGLALPLEDASVDAVFANMYLHHIVEPPLALAEMVRVLKPGGRVVITDVDEHHHEWMRAEMADVWLGFDRGQIRCWFEEAGLTDVAVDCTGSDCCGSSAGGDAVAISIFVAVGTKPGW